MTDLVIELDDQRGKLGQGGASTVRDLLAQLCGSRHALHQWRGELEARLMAAPALSWSEAADKARHLQKLFAVTPMADTSRRQRLISSVLEDFARLSREDGAHGLDSNHHQAEHERRLAMANREQRGNREKRKPKAEKPKPVVQAPFGSVQGGSQRKSAVGKKGR